MSKRKTQQFTYSGRSDYSIEYDYSKDPPTVVALYQGTTVLDPNLNSNVIKSSEAKQAVISSLKSVDITKGNALAANTNWDPTFDPSAQNKYTSNSPTNTQQAPTNAQYDPTVLLTQIGGFDIGGFKTLASITNKKNALDELYKSEKTFIYPEDLLIPENDQVKGSNSGQDYCKITAVKYDPPNTNVFVGAGTSVTNILKTGLISANNAGAKKAAQPGTEKYIGSVILPMPNKLSDVNEATWGQSAMNPITQVGLQALSSGSIGNNLSQVIAGAITDPALKSQLIAKFGLDAVRLSTAGLIDVSPEDFLARTTGTIGNPNAELLFRGVKMRQFSFEWTFFPRSDTEATTVRKIIRFFKQNSAPAQGSSIDASGTSSENGTIVFAPNTFFVQFLNNKQDLKSVFKMKKSALTGMNITYTPSKQWQSVDDPNVKSQPIGMILQLQFTELVPIYQNDYIESDGLDDVGY